MAWYVGRAMWRPLKSSISNGFDDGLHVREVFFKSAAPGRGEPILGVWKTPRECFLTRDVLRFFELSRVDAQVPIGRVEQALEIVERQPFVHSQCTHDAEPQAFMNQSIERGGWRLPLGSLCLPTADCGLPTG